MSRRGSRDARRSPASDLRPSGRHREQRSAASPTPPRPPRGESPAAAAGSEPGDRRRRGLGLVGIVAIVAAVVAAAVVVGYGVHSATRSSSTTPVAGQPSVLLQLTGDGDTAVGSMLMAPDAGAGSGLELLVPSRLITAVCGYGQQDFGDVLARPQGATTTRQVLSSVLAGSRVDGSWLLSDADLAHLVDAVGGVTVDVDVTIAAKDRRTVVSKGDGEHLDGSQAARYATYVGGTRAAAAAQLSRMHEVTDALIRALPQSRTAVAAILRSAPSSAQSTLGADRLSGTLVAMAAADRRSAVLPIDLPVNTVDTTGAPSYSVNEAAISSLAARSLSAFASSSTAQRVTVELLNGVGTPGLAATTCPRLASAGLTYVGSMNAGSFGRRTSQVQVASNADTATGERVATALRLPAADVVQVGTATTTADVVVVLGGDYRP